MPNIYFYKEMNKDFKVRLKQELSNVFFPDENIAIKLPMGEPGNKYFLKPDLVRGFVDLLKETKVKPFLFDSPSMYPGPRNAPEDYLKSAANHGFTEKSMGCPIVVSNESVRYETEYMEAEVCKELVEADGMFVLSHIKGHMAAGFGGAIKNLGMGGVSKKTKGFIHFQARPVVLENCDGCGYCAGKCANKVISIENKKVQIEFNGCWGCGVCILECPKKALRPKLASFDKLLAEGAFAVTKSVKKAYYVNCLVNIARNCDCWSGDNKIVLGDIGFLMSKDIVAIDKKSFDLIKEKYGKDLFLEIHGKSPLLHIKEAERLGMGKLKYELLDNNRKT